MIELDLVGTLRDLNVASVVLRLVLAMLFGGTIGFERGIRQRAAGLRTHMLLCVGSASTMLCSQFLYASYGVGDPARLRGLTTAATLWTTACMGLAVGVGFYECALIMYILLIIILVFVSVLDKKYLKIPTSTALYLEVRKEAGLGDAIEYIHDVGWHIREVKEFPSGREDVLAVRMDLESDNALRGDVSAIRLLVEQPDVLRLEM